MSDDGKNLSAFQRMLASRERYQQTLDVSGFFGVGDKPLPKVTIQIPRKGEEIAALRAAKADAKAMEKGSALDDGDLSNDDRLLHELETCWALFHAYRDADHPERPLFNDPVWMRDNLDSDQLGCMLRLLEEVRKRRGPLPWELDREHVEAMRDRCVAAYDEPVPELALAHADRTYLSALFVEAMKLWFEERKELLRRLGEDEPVFTEEQLQAAADVVKDD